MEVKYQDPVVEEIRERGRHLTARFDNDPRRIMEYLKSTPNKNKKSIILRKKVIKEYEAEPYLSHSMAEERGKYQSKKRK
jgi:hypothetical protein